MRLLVTGGLGFIGSNFILKLLSENDDLKILNVDAELDEIEEFFDRKEDWYLSIVKATNKIYELFPNKGYKFHRGSEQVKAIYSAWQSAKTEKGLKLMDDK